MTTGRRTIKLAALFFACLSALPLLPQGNPWHVSMMRLIAEPQQFSRKQVAVIGFISFEREGDLLYLHREDYLHGIMENAIRIQRSAQMERDREHLDLNYVSVFGTFVAEPSGSIPSGTVIDVTRCTLWSETRDPRSQKSKDLHVLPPKKPAQP